MPKEENIELIVTNVQYKGWFNVYLIEAEEGKGRMNRLSWYVAAENDPTLKIGDTVSLKIKWE